MKLARRVASPSRRKTMGRSGAVLWGIGLGFALFACASNPEAYEPLQRWQAPEGAVEVLRAEVKIGGVAAGDLDGRPGDEVVAVAGDGGVWTAGWSQGQWIAERVHELPGEAIAVAILPDNIGVRGFVTIGKQVGDEDSAGPGAAYLFLRRTSSAANAAAWQVEELLTDSALLHGVDSGPRGLVIAGYSREVHWLAPAPGGLKHSVIGSLPGPAKGVAWQGEDQVVVACASGELVRFTLRVEPGGTRGHWDREILWRYPDALARVDALGQQVAVCSNDGGLYFYQPSLSRDSVVYRSTDRLRGAVFLDGADLHLGAPWFLATAGYDGRVSLFPRFGASAQEAVHLVVDDNKLHHLAGGQVMGPNGPVPTLFTCGYSGRVLALPFRSQRSLTLAAGAAQQAGN